MASLVDIRAWQIPIPDLALLAGVHVLLIAQYYVLRKLAARSPWRRPLGYLAQVALVLLPLGFRSRHSGLSQAVVTVLAFYFTLKQLEATATYGYYQRDLPVVGSSKGKGIADTTEPDDSKLTRRLPLNLREYLIQVLRSHPSPASAISFPYLQPGFHPEPTPTATGYYDLVTGDTLTAIAAANLTDVKMPVANRLRSVARWTNDPPAALCQRLRLAGYFYYLAQAALYSLGVILLVRGQLLHPSLADPSAARRHYQTTTFPAPLTWEWAVDSYSSAFLFYWGMNVWFNLAYGGAAWYLGFPMPVLFDNPFLATSPRDFWSRRWNILFKDAFHVVVFLPVYRRLAGLVNRSVAMTVAALTVFLFSALMHEYVLICIAGRSNAEELAFFVVHGLLTCGQVLAQQTLQRYAVGTLFPPSVRQAWAWFNRTPVATLACIILNIYLLLWTGPLFLHPYLRNGFHVFLAPLYFPHHS
ncbi:hypothetical protein IWQ60_005828 [Tieghemiomyces parasiticus]|uniref:Wax synthase domain-containing protein n=1 Tax=Tieghemiomyces parasiticus TaxID=78921 RepID=A0A9W8A5J8_9FUNG|nr:hypothetical protein IWQ60_005828 [Tieghemiomyces parasiticus]